MPQVAFPISFALFLHILPEENRGFCIFFLIGDLIKIRKELQMFTCWVGSEERWKIIRLEEVIEKMIYALLGVKYALGIHQT